jgi:hypothetical protein
VTEEARPSTKERLVPSNIEANEKAAIQSLVRLSRLQARAKSEIGRYLTAQQILQRRRALLGSSTGARLRGNYWVVHGYRFNLVVPESDFYAAFAVPAVYGESGIHSFYIDARGVLRGGDKGGGRASKTDPPIRPKTRQP